MFGLPILDIAIGLIFVYLLLALVCTAVNELFAGWLNLRAKDLAMGIHDLLSQDVKKEERERARAGVADNSTAQMTGLAKEFYDHPLIRVLCEGGKPPSYIPARTFALTLLDLAAPAVGGRDPLADVRGAIASAPFGGGLKRSLLVLVDEARGDVDRTRENIEIWFNTGMDRVSAAYKKRSQTIVLVIAALITIVANADTVKIATALSRNTALRASLVAQAEAFARQPPPGTVVDTTTTPAQRVKESIAQVQGLGIPLGWHLGGMPDWGPGEWGARLAGKTVGILVTMFAVSLGAPFWFDMLNKVITIRAAGRSPDEAPKKPEAKPKRKEELPPQ
ncbi:MAG: hypothetical protein WKG32_13725 [Gemmatimonadaceae bacterium]